MSTQLITESVEPASAPAAPPPVPRSTRWRNLVQPRNLVVGLCALIVAYLTLGPLIYLLDRTFFDTGTFSTGAFGRTFLPADHPGRLIANSLEFSIGAAVLAFAVGTALAYLQVRTDVPFKGLLLAASLTPLIIPGILYAFAWITLTGQQIGLFNAWAQAIFGHQPFDTYSMWGMIFVQGLHSAPVAFLFMVSAFRSMDPSLEESASICGAGGFTTLRRVTLPLLRPAVLSALLLVFIVSVESFEIPGVLGLQNGIYVFASQIYFVLQKSPIDYAVAGALAIMLLLTAVVATLLSQWATRGTRQFQTISGKAFRPRIRPLGRKRIPVAIGLVLYFVITVALPVVMIVYVSFSPYLHTPGLSGNDFTLVNYRTLFADPIATHSIINSLELGVAAATIVMALTSVLGWFIYRTKAPGRKVLDALAMTPLVIPGLVLGLALLFIYLRLPLPIYGTLWILLIAYCTKFLPYGIRYAGAAMVGTAAELEESARIHGASWGQSMRRILFPLSRSAIAAGWIFVFIATLRELSTSLLIYSPGKEVMSVYMWEQFSSGDLPILAAIGSILIVCLTVFTVLGHRLMRRFGRTDLM